MEYTQKSLQGLYYQELEKIMRTLEARIAAAASDKEKEHLQSQYSAAQDFFMKRKMARDQAMMEFDGDSASYLRSLRENQAKEPDAGKKREIQRQIDETNAVIRRHFLNAAGNIGLLDD